MKASRRFVRTTLTGASLLAVFAASASAQAPSLLPYTIQNLVGGGKAPTVGDACTDPRTGVTGIAYDLLGDGCPVGSGSVVVGGTSDIHDVAVDVQGNVFFVDNGSNGVIRRIDAHSGIITVYAGSFAYQSPVCAATLDKYGDGCPANDGKANAARDSKGAALGGYTGALGKIRGLSLSQNGDLVLSDYGVSVVQKISGSTGLMSVVAGSLASTSKLSSNGGVKGFSGDNGVAFNPAATPTPQGAALNSPRGVGRDLAGNVYIADSTNNVIRKVTYTAAQPLGIITTIVGSDANAPTPATPAVPGNPNGDGGPAGAALLLTPESVQVDALGNIFIGDFGTNRLRVVYMSGTVVARLIALENPGTTAVVGNIYSIAGSGAVAGATAPGNAPVLATSVTIGGPRKFAVDAADNVYLADSTNAVVWFLDASSGFMRVIAGTLGKTSAGAGCPAKTDAYGDNCAATLATLSPNSAMGVAVDSSANIYITDSGDVRVRKVETNQSFPATAAGSSVQQTLLVHFSLADLPSAVQPYVITGSPDFTLATSACTVNPDTTQDCLLTVSYTPSSAGLETAVLTVNSVKNGSASFALNGIGLAASVAFEPGATASVATGLKAAQGLAQDAAGALYVADTGSNRILKVVGGTTTVIAGTGTSGFSGDGAAALAATLKSPAAVAVGANGMIYIADTGNQVIRQVNPSTGIISTIAGGATAICPLAADSLGDGCPGNASTFKSPSGLATDPEGNLYIADSGDNVIRELTASGYVVEFGGGAAKVCAAGDVFGDGCPARQSSFQNPTALQIDSRRNLYIADTGDNLVREIDASTGNVVAIAGTGSPGASGNGGTATGAQLNGPTGVAVDAAGNVYIADTANGVIRIVSGTGTINTVAGTLGAPGTGTLPGSAFAVQFTSPTGIVSSGSGFLTVLDSGNNRILSVARGSVSYNFGRTNLGFSSPTLQIQETSTGSLATRLGSPIFTPTPTPPFALAGTSSQGCTAGQTLTPGASCLLAASFTPSATQLGVFNSTYTETTTPVLAVAPFIRLAGTGAVLTPTTSATRVTNPATGSPQYSVPFTVTTTISATCNVAAPTCFPTGNVTFFVDGTQVGLPVAVSATGTASASITGVNVGVHVVTAVYSGDLYYASSSAPALNVSVTRGSTTTVATLNPASGPQFNTAFNLTAKTSSQSANIPTGTFTFFAGTVQLGTAAVDARTGSGTLSDTLITGVPPFPLSYYQNFGLPAGTYAITAVYSGDTNYAPSTSPVATLTIQPDAATFGVSLSPSGTTGTAQGSTASLNATVSPNNTYGGTVSFSCANMPANAVCTFGPPTTLTFVPVPGVPSSQTIAITLWTDIPAGVTPGVAMLRRPLDHDPNATALATLLGWPLLLSSFAGVLAFRKRLRHNPRGMASLTLLALLGLLAGSTAVLTGCSAGNFQTQVTPVGTYSINLVSTGTGGATVTTPITFKVGPGFPGQL
jgi:sugar lactone lactonase YvrE